LAEAIILKGFEMIDNGANPQELKKGIDKAVEYVCSEIKKMAIPVGDDNEMIRQVATVSANNDSSIGDLIAEAYRKIGNSGVINIEDAKGVDTTIKMTDGFTFPRGWVSPYFITNRAKDECELIEPYILIYDKPISQLQPLMPILEQVAAKQKSLLIICEDADGEALATLTMNAAQKRLSCCVVTLAFLGNSKVNVMEDIAAVTGGTFINELKGVELKNVTIKHLGLAKKVVIGKESTTIIGGIKDEDRFNELVDGLKESITKTDDDYEKILIEKRIARLKEGVAILSIGGATETEMNERKDRADDAVKATKAAIEEGCLVGGGTAFLRVPLAIVKETQLENGYNLIFDAIEEPLKQICRNAGVDENKILKDVKDANGGFGYNCKTDTIEDLAKAGILDAAKAVRCSLQNAASVATMILTTECVISDTI
jgi:chaperonin GroEL